MQNIFSSFRTRRTSSKEGRRGSLFEEQNSSREVGLTQRTNYLVLQPWFSQQEGEMYDDEEDPSFSEPFFGIVSMPSPFSRTNVLSGGTPSYSSGALSDFTVNRIVMRAPYYLRGTGKDVYEHWYAFLASPSFSAEVVDGVSHRGSQWRGFFTGVNVLVKISDLGRALSYYLTCPLYEHLIPLRERIEETFPENGLVEMYVQKGFREADAGIVSAPGTSIKVQLCLTARDPRIF